MAFAALGLALGFASALPAHAASVPFVPAGVEARLTAALDELDDFDQRFTVDDVANAPLASGFAPVAARAGDIRYRARWYRFALAPEFACDAWRLAVSRKADEADLYVPRPCGGYRVVRFGMAVPVTERPLRS